LRERRRKLKLTQIQVAELSGCSVPSVIAAERGKPTLRLETLVQIAYTLGLVVDVRPMQPDERPTYEDA
jgi:transcriptional regulator with XRE-family HTH domain